VDCDVLDVWVGGLLQSKPKGFRQLMKIRGAFSLRYWSFAKNALVEGIAFS
jgi:hypothetical protein